MSNRTKSNIFFVISMISSYLPLVTAYTFFNYYTVYYIIFGLIIGFIFVLLSAYYRYDSRMLRYIHLLCPASSGYLWTLEPNDFYELLYEKAILNTSKNCDHVVGSPTLIEYGIKLLSEKPFEIKAVLARPWEEDIYEEKIIKFNELSL